MTLAKKFFVKTYGCQMNVYDSARMADVMAADGYDAVDRPEEADVVVLNTCHIREKAAEKVYSELGRLRPLKNSRAAAGDKMTIAVAGCVAQAEGEEMQRRAPFVDVVLGPQAYHRLGALVAEARGEAAGQTGHLIDTEFPAETKFDFLPEEHKCQGLSAFLTVQEGCDKFCSFCVVPYTRGAEYSRPATDVIAEARRQVAGGAREITLLGQNVNAYHGAAPGAAEGDWGLGRLILALAEIDGLDRIRYTTSHPADMDDELIRAHGDVPQLMPYLHLPVQSGSDRILAAMNRRYTADEYRRLVDRLRQARPDLALSSDFIVGFPGETEADFQATLELVGEIAYAQAFSFKYSARPGTPAAEAERGATAIDDSVKQQRLAELQARLAVQQRRFNRALVGTTLAVLFDRPGRRDGQMAGRSPFLQPVHVAGNEDLYGRLVDVTIEAALSNSLQGCIASPGLARTGPGPGKTGSTGERACG